MKKISVIIPAYNSQKKINVTLESLISQTNINFEIIVIDDGSTDKTYKTVKEILNKSHLSNYRLIQQENMGVSVARNRGIEESTNEYVYFLDADDYISKDMIETLNKKINNYQSEIISWGYNEVKEDGTTLSRYSDAFHFGFKEMTGIEALKNNILDNTLNIWTGSAIYKKAFLIKNNLKFTPYCQAGEDLEFIYKSLANASSFLFIDKILSFYVQGEFSVIRSYNIRKFDSVFAMERTANYLRKNIRNDNHDFADYLENYLMPVHYRYSFMSSYIYLSVEKDFLNIRKIKYFNNEIENNYPEHPNLDKEMRKKLIKTQDKDVKAFFSNKFFAISPFVFMSLLELRNKLKRK